MSAERFADIECQLYVGLQRDRVRMVPQCMRPRVKIGTENCTHYLGDTPSIRNSADVTDICLRATQCRSIGGRT